MSLRSVQHIPLAAGFLCSKKQILCEIVDRPHDPKIITMLMISVILIIMIFTTTIMIYLRYKSQV